MLAVLAHQNLLVISVFSHWPSYILDILCICARCQHPFLANNTKISTSYGLSYNVDGVCLNELAILNYIAHIWELVF